MRFDSPNKKPLSNFAAEAAPLKGAVLLASIGPSAQLALAAANRELIRRIEAKVKAAIDVEPKAMAIACSDDELREMIWPH